MPPPKGRSKKNVRPKRPVRIAGRNTHVWLEDAFWEALKEIAAAEGMSVSQLAEAVNSRRTHFNLSSALRLYVLGHYWKKRPES
jgi:predicted DNA-binding ribbon-helix-helix protein